MIPGGGSTPTREHFSDCFLLPLFQSSGGCSAQLGPRGTFLDSDLSPALSPSSSANSLGPPSKQKPPLPYTVPGKWLNLDPYSPCCPAPVPGFPLLNQDPHSKLHYPSSPAMLATSPFPQSVPMRGYGGDLSSGYPVPYSAPHLPAGTPGTPMFGTHRGQLPPGSSSRSKARGGSTKTQRTGRLPTPPSPGSTPACLTQLLTSGRRQGVEGWGESKAGGGMVGMVTLSPGSGLA